MSCFCVRKAPPCLPVYRAANNFTLICFLGFISNLTLHASHPPFSSLSLSLHVTNRRSPHRTLHARASLRDRGSDADQQTQGPLNEDRRAGHRAIKYDIPGFCCQGILESCHACIFHRFLFGLSCVQAMIGQVVAVIVHAISFSIFSVYSRYKSFTALVDEPLSPPS